MKTKKQKRTKPKWTNRKRLVHLSLLFDVIVIVFCLLQGEDLKLYDTAVTMAFLHGSSVLGAYVFGVVYQDVKKPK